MATVLTFSARAVVTDIQSSPYQSIPLRNVFRLSPAKPVVIEPVIKPISLPRITLTGITTILGRRMAFLTIAGTRPGEAPTSYVFAEGQQLSEIEVQSIDDKAGIVRILNHGEGQILDFEHDGAKPTGDQAAPIQPPSMSPPVLPRAVNTPALTPEEQTALIEIGRVKSQQNNDAVHKIFPTTQMTAEPPQN